MNENLIIALASVVVLVVIFGGAHFLKNEACNQKSISFEDHKFGMFSGCMVKHKDRWIPLDNIRGFDDH